MAVIVVRGELPDAGCAPLSFCLFRRMAIEPNRRDLQTACSLAMSKVLPRISLLALLASTAAPSASAAPPLVTHLRCEYLEEPLMVDTPRPRLFWQLESEVRGQCQTAWQVLVASSPHFLREDRADLWDSGRVSGQVSTHIEYAGRPLESRARCFWKVRVWDKDGKVSRWSDVASWTMGLLRPEDWQADWISFRDPTPLPTDRTRLHLPPAQFYRRCFTVQDKPVRRAVLYASALGIYEPWLNGRRASQDFFAPGWTDYRQRVYYRAHEVTGLIEPGTNVMGVVVADGWYAGYLGYGRLLGYGPHGTGRNIYGKTPALLAQLEIEFDDGTRQVLGTDPTWEVSGDGPYREADLLMGETYDARREDPNWCRPPALRLAGTGPATLWTWEPALRATELGSVKAPFTDGAGMREQKFGFVRPSRLEAYPAPPVRFVQELPACSVTARPDGTYIFDLGQNFAGLARLRVRGPAGTVVRLRYGEMLHPDGRLMTENLRQARATDTYILRGEPGGEVYVPRFTYHGFRYVEISGYPGEPGPAAVTGVVLHSDTPLTSSFVCSDPMVNQLFQNVVWTQRANFLELPTDCPQRDERLGWLGDAQIYARTATYNADVAAFFTKWLREVAEAQLPAGPFPDYCPWPFQHGRAFATAWTDAGVLVPQACWQAYGDRRLLERLWPAMTRFMAWRESRAVNDLGGLHPDANSWGDWLNLQEPTPLDFIDTTYLALTRRAMAAMATGLGRHDEAAAYQQQFERTRAAFAAKYLRPDGTLTVDTQTAYALALEADLIPESLKAATGARLAEKIRAHGVRMATGILGTRSLLPALSATGGHDLAVRLLQSRRFPSWGYAVENGATTIWERWDSFTLEHGFNGIAGGQNASMNSFSHYAFGAVCEWMFRTLAGIDTAGPGFHRLRIRPRPPTLDSNPEHPSITWVRARYDALTGSVRVHWRVKAGQFALDLTVPANVSATVWLPTCDPSGVRESGRLLRRVQGLRRLGAVGNELALEVPAGTWRFTAPWP